MLLGHEKHCFCVHIALSQLFCVSVDKFRNKQSRCPDLKGRRDRKQVGRSAYIDGLVRSITDRSDDK